MGRAAFAGGVRSISRRVSLLTAFALYIAWSLSSASAASAAPAIRVQVGHSKTISSVSISRDGRFAVTAAQDGMVKLWDLSTGKLLSSVPLGGMSVWGYLSPDARWYAAFGEELSIIDCATGATLRKIKPAKASRAQAISPDGRYFASSNDETNAIDIYELSSGRLARSLAGHTGAVRALAFTPDGKGLLSGSMDATLRLWDLSAWNAKYVFRGHRDMIFSMAVSRDSRRALSFSYNDRALILWDLSSGARLKAFTGIDDLLLSICFSADGKRFACGNSLFDLKLYDIGSGSVLRSDKADTEVSALALTPDGSAFLAGGNLMRLMDASTLSELRSFRGNTASIESVAFVGDAATLLSASYDGALTLWDARGGKALRTYVSRDSRKPGRIAMGAVPSADGASFLAWYSNGIIRWDRAKATLIGSCWPEPKSYQSLAFSPDGRLAAGGDISGNVSLIDLEAGKKTGNLSAGNESAWIFCVAFSPDGSKVLAGVSDKSLRLWDAAARKPLKVLWGHKAPVLSVAFSPDGAIAASGSRDGAIIVWDLATGKALRSLAGHAQAVESLAFFPDGKRLASGSQDRTIKLWDLGTGKAAATLRGHVDAVSCLAVSPDGSRLASGGGPGDTSVRLWDAATGRPLSASICSADGEWITWTDEGYWDGSPNCGRSVAMVSGLESWNIDQFAARNNRPDLVLRSLGGSGEALEAYYRGLWQKRLKRLGLKEADLSGGFEVPVARIASDRVDGAFAELGVELSTNAESLRSYQVFVNDVPLYKGEGKAVAGARAAFSERVELGTGDNKIEVSCLDSRGAESFRASRQLRRGGTASPNLYFMAFGVSRYADDPAIPSLRYPAKDARDLEAAFKRMEGRSYGKVLTRVYVDEEATKANILSAGAFLDGASVDDTFVLFIAGHGVQVDPEGLLLGEGGAGRGLAVAGSAAGEPTEYEYFYLSSDARRADIRGTAVAFAEIEGLLQGIAPRKKLFLMDTCQSGELDTDSLAPGAAAGARAIHARALATGGARGLSVRSGEIGRAMAERDRWIYNDLVRRSGAIVFSGSRGGEYSYEADDTVPWKQGAFTLEILEALSGGAADADRDGFVSVDELRLFVSTAVPGRVKELDPGYEQHPTVDRDNIYQKFGFPGLH